MHAMHAMGDGGLEPARRWDHFLKKGKAATPEHVATNT